MSIFDRVILAWLAFTGKADYPRWLRQRDEAWAEADRYRRAASLRLGEFIGAEATAERIEARLRFTKPRNV